MAQHATKITDLVRTRNWVAVAARFRKAGAHGGTAKQKNRRDRKRTRQALRRGEE